MSLPRGGGNQRGTSNRRQQAYGDRVDQLIAQLSLSRLDSQFPVEIDVQKYSLFERNAIGDEKPSGELKRLDRYVASLTSEHELTQFVENYYELPELSADGFLREIARLEHGKLGEGYGQGSIFEFGPYIAKGEYGIVNDMEILPNGQYHYRGRARVGAVQAAVKVERILSTVSWLNYVAVQRLIDMDPDAARKNKRSPQYKEISRYLRETKTNKLLPRWSQTDGSRFEEQRRRLLGELAGRYSDITNPAYMGALGYYLCGRLTEHLLSPAFALLYCTARLGNDSYFPDETVARFGPEVNRGFPVQITVTQKLDEPIGRLIRDHFFDNTESTMAMLVQVIFGLSVAQEHLGMVHNDLHAYNVLRQAIDADAQPFLYYKRRRSHIPIVIDNLKHETVKRTRRSDRPRYYKVPTHGSIYKLIDFDLVGFSTVDRLGRETLLVSSDSVLAAGKPYHHSYGSDLKKFANAVLHELSYDEPLPDFIQPADSNRLKKNPLKLLLEGLLYRTPHDQEQYESQRKTNVTPPELDSELASVPALVIMRFDKMFGITKDQIPDDEIIYRCYG